MFVYSNGVLKAIKTLKSTQKRLLVIAVRSYLLKRKIHTLFVCFVLYPLLKGLRICMGNFKFALLSVPNERVLPTSLAVYSKR